MFGPVRQPDRDRRLAGVVGEEVGPYGGRDEVPFSDRLFHPEATFDLSHDGGVEADPCDESEIAAVHDAEVDALRRRAFTDAFEQRRGGFDRILRDAVGAGEDVRAAAGEHAERNLGARDAVDDFVQRPVSAQDEHEVVALVNGTGGEVLRVAATFRLCHVDDQVARQCPRDDVACTRRHGRRLGIDDQDRALHDGGP